MSCRVIYNEQMVPERYGPYRVYEQLGKGGMATVHRAERDTPRGVQEVALKRLTPTLDEKPVKWFLDEARLLRYLKHPNIADTYDSGRVFGTYFIAMEYIKGPTVRELIEHCATTVGPVPQAIVLNLMAQLCAALDYAHKRTDENGRPLGIIHRDVTPTNLIIDHDGVLKLVDFGLAKATLMSEPSTAGVLKGKLGYVAPEYTRGKIDHRADLWAVGIITYEMLTGRRLFDGANTVDTISRIRELPVPRPSIANPNVSPHVDEVVMTALERDPRERWPSASAMGNRIRSVTALIGEDKTNAQVIEWVNWALAQKQPRRVQLTPIVAMPTVAQAVMLGNAEPAAAKPPAAATQPVRTSSAMTPRNIAIACGILLALLAIVLVVR